MKPKKIKVSSFSDYIGHVGKLTYRAWVYRGHSDTSWVIESTLTRFFRTHKKRFPEKFRDTRENDSVRKFQIAAHQYLSHLPPSDDKLSWLAVMQHFGAPTRLIDFTISPLVALYFAAIDSVDPTVFNEKLKSGDIEKKYKPFQVHCVHVDSMRELLEKILNGANVSMSSYKKNKNKYVAIGKDREQKLEFIDYFEGVWQNPRQVAQQSVFMVTSKVMMDVHNYLMSMDSSPEHYDNPWLIFEFNGGQNMYREMAKYFLSANLTAATLFPGIEGLARSIYLRMFEGVKLFD